MTADRTIRIPVSDEFRDSQPKHANLPSVAVVEVCREAPGGCVLGGVYDGREAWNVQVPARFIVTHLLGVIAELRAEAGRIVASQSQQDADGESLHASLVIRGKIDGRTEIASMIDEKTRHLF